MTTTAVLGTGKMGAGMARSLLAAGHDVRVWNRSREKAEPLAEDGATVADSPGEAVRGAEVVVVMLYDADSVVSVLESAEGEYAAGAVVVQASTVGLEIDRVAEAAERLGVRLLDAPVLGTKSVADSGQLVVLASGDEADLDVARPVLDAIGSKTVWVGAGHGPASRLKLACNSWVATITAATGQAVAMAEGLGLDPQLFLDAIDGTAVDTKYAHLKGAAMISGETGDAAFSVDGVAKDLGLIGAAARGSGVATDLVDAVGTLFGRASDAGHGDDDMAAVRSAFS